MLAAEQQGKLGVSAEESKAHRLKRQQARFRDRGGAFVPSTSNPLVDILLARTVSGESPSKAPQKHAAKRPSSSKARRASPTHKAGAATPGSSKSKLPASRKGKAKVVEPQTDPATKPAPKRRGKPAQGKKKAPDSDTEQAPPPKSKSTSKGKGKQRTAPSTSDTNPKSKPKPRARAKSNTAKQVVEILASDDDQTLVDVPHKVKSNRRRSIRYEDDGETDDSDNLPIVRKGTMSQVGNSKAPGTKTVTRAKTERIAGTGTSGMKTLEVGEERTQDDKYTKPSVKKRPVSRDDDDDNDVAAPPAKKGKAANSTSAKLKTAIASELAPRTTKDVKSGEHPKAAGKGKGKGRGEPARDIVEAEGEDIDERPLERVSKPKKRKKEEDNYDDRPRKAIKFSEPVPPHSSSQKLKENQSDSKHKRAVKSSAKDESDALPRRKLAMKPPSSAKMPKGPPREVLERIKASAAQHLRCVDSEPDELDCLS